MPTDEERREVARRLREFSKDRWSLTVGGNSATIRYAISDIVFGDKRYHSGVDLLDRLADLIDPDTTGDTTKTVLDTTKTPTSSDKLRQAPTSSDTAATHTDASATCDRDALLALAEEMDMDASCHAYIDDYVVNDYARRIREALEVGR